MKYNTTIKYAHPEEMRIGLYPKAAYEITVIIPSCGSIPAEASLMISESYGRTASDALNSMAALLNGIADKAREMAKELEQ